MATQTTRSEKDKLKDKRFKENVTQLLKRYEREVQEARNREAEGLASKEKSPEASSTAGA